jgi:hypothetical protein
LILRVVHCGTRRFRSGPFKKTTSTTPRDAVENILDTLKGDGSLQRLFAAYGAWSTSMHHRQRLADKWPVMRAESNPTEGEL